MVLLAMTMMMMMMTMGIDEGGWEGVLEINAFLPFSCVCVGRGGEGEGVDGNVVVQTNKIKDSKVTATET